MPDFAANTQTIASRMATRLGRGAETIDLPSAPDFAKTHDLTGDDPAAVRAAFDGKLMAFFAAHPDLSVEAANGNLIVYRFNKLVPAEGIPGLLEDGNALVQALR